MIKGISNKPEPEFFCLNKFGVIKPASLGIEEAYRTGTLSILNDRGLDVDLTDLSKSDDRGKRDN